MGEVPLLCLLGSVPRTFYFDVDSKVVADSSAWGYYQSVFDRRHRASQLVEIRGLVLGRIGCVFCLWLPQQSTGKSVVSQDAIVDRRLQLDVREHVG